MKLVTILGLACLIGVNSAWADPGTKLGRGLSNTAFGMFEIVNEVGNQSDKHGPFIGVPSGLVRGAVFGIVRTVAGIFEIISFPFPNGKGTYDPIVLPESVFQRR